MGSYRCFFRGRSGAIEGRDDFEAHDDVEAAVLAALLGDACSDICDTFELWQGARRLDIQSGKSILVNEITARMQASLILREETIRDSQWMVARSHRLLERLAQFKAGGLTQSTAPEPAPCTSHG